MFWAAIGLGVLGYGVYELFFKAPAAPAIPSGAGAFTPPAQAIVGARVVPNTNPNFKNITDLFAFELLGALLRNNAEMVLQSTSGPTEGQLGFVMVHGVAGGSSTAPLQITGAVHYLPNGRANGLVKDYPQLPWMPAEGTIFTLGPLDFAPIMRQDGTIAS